jgi:hypothetical protein
MATKVWTKLDRTYGRCPGNHARYINGHNRRISGSEYRIEDRGFSTPCWIWVRGHSGGGYAVNHNSKMHRVYYERANGPIPDGMAVHHLCHQPGCVNPEHLQALTMTDHVRTFSTTKLTVEGVAEIRNLLLLGESRSSIADSFGVTKGCIDQIAAGRNWTTPALV